MLNKNKFRLSTLLFLLVGVFMLMAKFLPTPIRAADCTALAVNPGLFIDADSTAWSTASTTSQAGRNVTLTTSSITATGPTGSVSRTKLPGHVLKYRFLGSSGFVLILDSETGGTGEVTHRVILIDFTTTPPTEKLIITGTASSGVAPPNVQYSVGTSTAFLVFNPTGTGVELKNMGIYRSDNGGLLCAGPSSFTPTAEISGVATATNVVIKHGGAVIGDCPLPSGKCAITPSTVQSFPDAVLGGAKASTTASYTITNSGDDCLTINDIASAPPFVKDSTSKPLPAKLSKDDSITVTVRFTPTSVGSTGTKSLTVVTTPATTCALLASGNAVAAAASLEVTPLSKKFGPVLTGSATLGQDFMITAKGTETVTLSPLAPTPAPFSVTQPLTTMLTPGTPGATTKFTVTFSASAKGAFDQNIVVAGTSRVTVPPVPPVSVTGRVFDPTSIIITPAVLSFFIDEADFSLDPRRIPSFPTTTLTISAVGEEAILIDSIQFLPVPGSTLPDPDIRILGALPNGKEIKMGMPITVRIEYHPIIVRQGRGLLILSPAANVEVPGLRLETGTSVTGTAFIGTLQSQLFSAPTLNQWGMILMSLLLLTVGTVFIIRRSPVRALQDATGIHLAGTRPERRVFAAKPFTKVLVCMLILFLFGLVVTSRLSGSISTLDVAGALLCTLVISYMVHLLFLVAKDQGQDI